MQEMLSLRQLTHGNGELLEQLSGILSKRDATGFYLIYDFLTDRRSSILGIWAAPGGRETFQKGGGLRPRSFWKVGAAQTVKIDDFRAAEKSYI